MTASTKAEIAMAQEAIEEADGVILWLRHIGKHEEAARVTRLRDATARAAYRLATLGTDEACA